MSHISQKTKQRCSMEAIYKGRDVLNLATHWLRKESLLSGKSVSYRLQAGTSGHREE